MKIDPLQLAQFMCLPGAAELVEAFSAIPPGEVRDSAVSHVQVLARASGWNPPHPFGVETAKVVPRAPSPRMLTSSPPDDLAAASLDGQIVEMALRGWNVDAIAFKVEASVAYIRSVLARARREGGVDFPGEPARAKPKKASGSRKGIKMPAAPCPMPPYWWEDPASPVWDNPALLPHNCAVRRDMSGIGPLDTRNYKTMTSAAARRGITLRAYIEGRVEVVRRSKLGESPTQIASAILGGNPQEVYNVLGRVGLSRMETLNARPMPTPEVEPEVEAVTPEPVAAPMPEPVPGRGGAGTDQLARAAHRFGFESTEAYDQARERALALRMRGVAPAHIGPMLGKPYAFVKIALEYHRKRGVVVPPVDIRAHEREAAA